MDLLEFFGINRTSLGFLGAWFVFALTLTALFGRRPRPTPTDDEENKP